MVCRVCLKSTEPELNIFDQNGIEQRIPIILREHLWFTPSPNDAISTVICFSCWHTLLDFHRFYETTKEAHKFYSDEQEILGTAKDSMEFSNPIEILEADFCVKEEKTDFNDENWLNRQDLQEQTAIHEAINIKSENTDVYELEEKTTNENLIKTAKKSLISDEDYDDTDQSAYEPEKKEIKKANKNQKNVASTKVNKHERPQTSQKSNESTPEKLATIKKSTSQEKRCWSSPQDDEMVRKHLPLNCEICCFHVENYRDMIKHFQAMHKNIQPYIVCCGRRITSKQRVVQHAYKHEDPNYFQCETCKKNFTDHYGLRSHISAHHPEEEQLVYQCDQCDKRFSRSYLLKLHKPVHIPVAEHKFMCNKCPTPKAFASDHLLNIHDTLRHKRAVNVCHVCAKTIRDNQAFEKHVRLHFEDSGPRVKCPHDGCDAYLKDEENLKVHLRRHKQENKTFACNQCKRVFNTRQALSSHKNYAHNTEQFSCNLCSKTFKRKITLKEHMAYHSGEPLYKCPFCTRTFNSNANMHSHKKKQHPVEWENWRKTKTTSAQITIS